MSQQETEELEQIQDPQEVSESRDEDMDDSDLPTYEDYLKMKERAEKAEKRIVQEKREAKLKKQSVEEGVDVDVILEKKLAEREFYRENPEAKAYKDKIDSYVKKGLEISEAYLLASKKDREIESNSDAYGNPQVSGKSQWADSIQLVTISQFDALSPKAQSDYLEKTSSKYGEAKFK